MTYADLMLHALRFDLANGDIRPLEDLPTETEDFSKHFTFAFDETVMVDVFRCTKFFDGVAWVEPKEYNGKWLFIFHFTIVETTERGGVHTHFRTFVVSNEYHIKSVAKAMSDLAQSA